MVKSGELLGAKECPTLQTRWCINQCCYNLVHLYLQFQLLPSCKNLISVLVSRQVVHMLHISFSNQQSHTEFISPLCSNRKKKKTKSEKSQTRKRKFFTDLPKDTHKKLLSLTKLILQVGQKLTNNGNGQFPASVYKISGANGTNYCYKLQINLQQWVADIMENYKMHYDVQELIVNLCTPMQSTWNYQLLLDKPETR